MSQITNFIALAAKNDQRFEQNKVTAKPDDRLQQIQRNNIELLFKIFKIIQR